MAEEADRLERREFIKMAVRAGLSVAACGGLGYWLYNRGEPSEAVGPTAQIRDYRVPLTGSGPQMVIARGPSPERITKAAIAALGGMEAFVSRGDIVVVKPNISWDRIPEQAATTNPEVVRTVVELCYNAGAKKVIVTDNPNNEPRRCFQRSGIASAGKSAGAEIQFPEKRKFRNYPIKGEVLDVWPVYTTFLEADKVINMPIVKHHNLTRATIAMKNWYGILGGQRNQLHQDIHVSIADLATFMQPTLTVLDAVRILMTNGPQGGNLADVKRLDTVAVSLDQVAIDAYGATLLGLKPENLGYIRIGHERGLGNMNYNELRVQTLGDVA